MLSFLFHNTERETTVTKAGDREMALPFSSPVDSLTNWTAECCLCSHSTNSFYILETNANIPTNKQARTHAQSPPIQTGWKKQDKADNLFSLKQPSHLSYDADREDRSSDQRDNVGYWLAGRGLSKCTRTTPLQITAAIYFYTANEAVRDGLHCQADLWIPMRGPIVSRWPWSFQGAPQKRFLIFHWLTKLQLNFYC